MFCQAHYVKLFESTYTKIVNSGLINDIETMYVIIVRYEHDEAKIRDWLSKFSKVVIIPREESHGEMATLKFLWDVCQTEDCNVLYLHSKGTSRGELPNITSWIDFMEYFCIEQYKMCLEKLQNYDTCGVELWDLFMNHYSGNFWWATSDYIKTRDRYDYNKCPKKEWWGDSVLWGEKSYCEFWLLDSPHYKAASLYDTHVEPYSTLRNRKDYEIKK